MVGPFVFQRAERDFLAYVPSPPVRSKRNFSILDYADSHFIAVGGSDELSRYEWIDICWDDVIYAGLICNHSGLTGTEKVVSDLYWDKKLCICCTNYLLFKRACFTRCEQDFDTRLGQFEAASAGKQYSL